MELTLNIILLVLATASTLVALGKHLLPDGPEPWVKKITIRTWISLACLLLAFAFGTWKEILSNREEEATAATAKQDKADLQKRLDNAQQNLYDFRVETETTAGISKQENADLEGQLNSAQRNLQDLHEDTKAAAAAAKQQKTDLQGQLDGAQRNLEDLRQALQTTTSQLTQESDANLLTAFGAAKTEVLSSTLIITFNGSLRGSTVESLFSAVTSGCTSASSWSLVTKFAIIQLRDPINDDDSGVGPNDAPTKWGINYHVYFNSGPDDITTVRRFGQPNLSQNHVVLTIVSDLSKRHISAAEIYDQTPRQEPVLSIEMSTLVDFHDLSDMTRFSNAHPDLGGNPQMVPLRGLELPTYKGMIVQHVTKAYFPAYTSRCFAVLARYWQNAISSVELRYRLSTESPISLDYYLSSRRVAGRYRSAIQFYPDTPPIVDTQEPESVGVPELSAPKVSKRVP